MSGNDEKIKIVSCCPKCGDRGKTWAIINGANIILGCINYERRRADFYGEFNLFGPYDERKEYVLANAAKLRCDNCGLIADKILFQNALNAIRFEVRRYGDLKYERKR
jgi:ssDNA-binding Zn-finger/Zn-ribbon topoisomerase 1